MTGPDHPGLLPAGLGGDPGDDGPLQPRSVRDWIVDTLCFLFAAAAGSVPFFVNSLDDSFPESPAFNLLLGMLACGAVWFRRRWPVAIALLLILLSVLYPTVAGASFVAMFTVAVHRKIGVALALTLLSIGSSLLEFRINPIDPETPTTYWTAVGFASALTVLAVGYGVAIRARRQLVMSLAERTRRAETEQELRVDQAKLRERERIAREMHDVLAHRLSLLSMHAGALEFRPDAPAEEIAKAAGVIRASAHQSLVDLREVIYVLRDPESIGEPQRPQITLADLPDLVRESEQAGMDVAFVMDVQHVEDAPAGLGRNAYRIVQEGLTNARKHAPQVTVHVQVSGAKAEGLVIEMRNALQGTRPRQAGGAVPGAGAGLAGLTERATLAGGRLEHGRTTAGEFRLWAWLPWPS
ncbi:histidine kinase [Kutzneria viridogrisea]|uniref:histidine kinase n=1 Tax=Kutzneria albida DSM 43870 TaxID=1449976 RepID=W5W4T5_9PSEU|nr:histidine kinase [Kutzneria albida]AHH95902.1 integral membrane sensor signal transduction histidine kinase [Kutzneria albida DSM 43870]